MYTELLRLSPLSPEEAVLSFFLYSLLGWVFESTLCAGVKQGRFVNRGFLLGPWCPIYGVGGVLCYLLLWGVKSLPLLFVAAMAVCGGLEYLTGWGMEKLFRARWWDYSELPLNLHGRVCLYGVLLFGLCNVAIRYLVQPLLRALLELVPLGCVRALGLLLTALLLSDLAATLAAWANLNRGLSELHQRLSDLSNRTLESLSERMLELLPLQITDESSGLRFQMGEWSLKLKNGELRFLRAFPGLRLFRYESLIRLLHLKERVQHGHRKEREIRPRAASAKRGAGAGGRRPAGRFYRRGA